MRPIKEETIHFILTQSIHNLINQQDNLPSIVDIFELNPQGVCKRLCFDVYQLSIGFNLAKLA